jgi:predicted transcriptional regulator
MAMTIRLTEELDAKLEQLAEDRKVSKQRAIEQLIEAADANFHRKAMLKEIFDTVMTRDAELMRRLADA